MNENEFGHFIGGNIILEGPSCERRNPADIREVVATYHDGTPEILDAAITAASDAFPAWSNELTRRDRAEVIFRAAQLLDTPDWRKKFGDAMIAEIGKTCTGASGEVEKTARILRHMAGLGTHTPDQVIHGDQLGVHMYTSTQPVGVVSAITPFNFPLAVPIWKIAPALIAGCTIVMKPSPHAPKTSALIMELLSEAMKGVKVLHDKNIGPGVINLVYGGPEIVQRMVTNKKVRAVTFTGSTDAGKKIYRLTANREPPLDPRHFVAEMGGQNALVVDQGVDLLQVVKAVINGAFFGEGQRCTATSRVIIMKEIFHDFMALLLEHTRALKIGPGNNPQSEVGPLVTAEAREAALKAVEASVRGGMKLLLGGHKLTGEPYDHGHFMEPTILQGDPNNREHFALFEEIFGPVIAVCPAEDLADAIRIVNSTAHQHAGSIYTKDLRNALTFASEANVGMVHGNGPTTGGDSQAPFGGLGGNTSLGRREMGPGMNPMDPFLDEKTVDINFAGSALTRGAR